MTRGYLFLEKELAQETNNVRCVLGKVAREPVNPLMVEDRPWEVRWDDMKPNLAYDEAAGKFKLWYSPFIEFESYDDPRVRPHDPDNWPPRFKCGRPGEHRAMGLCYACSSDGYHWTKPHLGLTEFKGSRENNILFRGDGENLHGAGVRLDSAERDPGRRYKMLLGIADQLRDGYMNSTGLAAAYSADGFDWSKAHRVADPDGWHTLWGDAHNGWIRAENLNRFVAITQGWKTNKIAERVKLRLESEDFENWSKPEVVEYDPYAEVHTHVLHSHDDLYIGLIHMVTTKDGQGDGTLDLEVSYSRDTKTWRRFAPGHYLIPRGAAGEMDCGCVLAAMAPINRGDETWIYYCGNDATIRGWRRGFWCLARMKRDRWGGFAHSGKGCGTIVTVPLSCLGNKLAINADASQGQIRVAVAGHDALTLDAGQPIHGDLVDGEVKWSDGADLTSIRNKQICLRFELRDATIYGFTFKS
jgi:hypothetical protein